MTEIQTLFSEGIHMVNIGLEAFGTAVVTQGAPCVLLDWKPTASPELLELVEKLRDL